MNTMQQEFDAVVQHLYKQNSPSVEEDGACVYRGKDGKMCAVGCRIPDSVYNKDMEYGSVRNLVENFRDITPLEIVLYQEMFSQLQRIHDGTDYWDGFEAIEYALEQIADEYNLTYNDPRDAK